MRRRPRRRRIDSEHAAAAIAEPQPPKAQILFVDDDEQLYRMMQYSLSQHGFDIVFAPEAATAIDLIATNKFQLILLELDLPDMDGQALLPALVQRAQAPILVLTIRMAIEQKIAALDAGASDYITKPFEPGELLARIRAALRRHSESEHHRFAFDPTMKLAIVDGKTVRLSPKEALLLGLLSDANGKLVGTADIGQAIWGASDAEIAAKIRVLVWQLRRKIEPKPHVPQFILAEVGSGYYLALG